MHFQARCWSSTLFWSHEWNNSMTALTAGEAAQPNDLRRLYIESMH